MPAYSFTINVICMECGNEIAVLAEPLKIDKNGKMTIAIDPHCEECEGKDNHTLDQGKSAIAWMRAQAKEINGDISDNESITFCARVISGSIGNNKPCKNERLSEKEEDFYQAMNDMRP
jgi:hypothetical protein